MIGLFSQSSQASEGLSSQELQMLMSMGMHAAFNGQYAQALLLFDALQVLRPNRSFPAIGRASALIAGDRADEAVRLLEATLVAHPNDADVHSLLRVALRNTKRRSQHHSMLTAKSDATVCAQTPAIESRATSAFPRT